MITKKNVIACGALSIIFTSSLVHAGTVTFIDDASDRDNWNLPGFAWTNGTIEDEVGTPEVDSMTVIWNDATGFLETVSINLRTSGYQNFDSLFINTDYQPNADGSLNLASFDNWDYFVHSGADSNTTYGGTATTSGIVPGDGLYQVDDEESYVYTTNINYGRTDHPNGIDNGSLTLLDSSFTREEDATSNALVYDFAAAGLTIGLGDSFAFAYSPWCANDIVWGTYTMDPVPEPATMLLFGTGLLGLAGLRRKKR